MRLKITPLLLSLMLLVPLVSSAAIVAGVNMEDKTTVNGQTLVLNGAGIRKKFFIKVYVGGLYLAAKQSDAAAVITSDSPRRMLLHFLYGVSKAQISEAWTEGLQDNTPNASAEVKANFNKLVSWMEPINKGKQ